MPGPKGMKNIQVSMFKKHCAQDADGKFAA